MRIFLLSIILCSACCADSSLIYSRILPFLGNSSDTAITAMTTDAAGNIYLAGWTEEPSLPVTAGVVQPNFAGGSCTQGGSDPNPVPPATFPCPDAFVVKVDTHGKIALATYLGGNGFDQATAIALDAAGNIYVGGITARFPVLDGSKYVVGATFIAKLDPSASALIYTAAIPGTGGLPLITPFGSNVPYPDVSMSMTVDSAGNAYFTAKGTAGFPVTANAIQTTGGIVTGKLDPTGQNLVYGTYLGGSGDDSPASIAIDASGNAYLTGTTVSADFPITAGVLQSTLTAGNANAFVAKLNASGTGLVYSTYLGGNSFAHGKSIRLDSSGNAYVLGTLNSAGFPVTGGPYQSDFNPGSSAFLAKLNSGATALVYATYVSSNSLAPGILALDAEGNAYVSGQAGPGFGVSLDALQPCRAGAADAFVLQLAPDGKFAAATYLGGSGTDNAFALEAMGDGTVLLAGLSTTSDFLVSADSPQSAPGYFVAKFRIADPVNAGQLCSILAPVNEGNFQDYPVAPGELVTFFGLRFGPEIGAGLKFDSSGKIATELAGVRVLFNDIPAPILYAQSLQINAQVPWELANQTSAQVHVEYQGARTRTGIVNLRPSAPALFPAKYGQFQGAIVNQDGTRNSAANPASAGSVVSAYGTGGGLTDPASVSGGLAPLKTKVVLKLPAFVTLDDHIAAEVTYAGAAPTFISGLFQINFRVPENLPALSAHRVDVKIGDASTAGFISVTVATK